MWDADLKANTAKSENKHVDNTHVPAVCLCTSSKMDLEPEEPRDRFIYSASRSIEVSSPTPPSHLEETDSSFSPLNKGQHFYMAGDRRFVLASLSIAA